VSAPFKHSEKTVRDKWVKRAPSTYVILGLRSEEHLPA